MAIATPAKPKKATSTKPRLHQSVRPRRASSKSGPTAAERRVRELIGLDTKSGAGVDVVAIRQLSGLSQAEFARASGYSTRAIAGWEAGGTLAGAGRRRMIELRRLFGALAELMPPDQVGNWLRNPNASFDDLAPMHVIERGESDRLWEMIHQIDANAAN